MKTYKHMSLLILLCLAVTFTITNVCYMRTIVSAQSDEYQTFEPYKVGDQKEFSQEGDAEREIIDNGSLSYKNGVKTFTITDDALQRVIEQEYGAKFSIGLRAKKRHTSGVTKVKNYGHGNINIYLSKGALNFLRGKSFKYGFGIVTKLIGAVAHVPSIGLAGTLITGAIGTIVSKMLNQVKPFKVGRVFKIRHWKYAGWRYQYA